MKTYYIADISEDCFDDEGYPWGNGNVRDYRKYDKLKKLFSDFIPGNRVLGIYVAVMPYIRNGIATGEFIYIATYSDNGQRAAASISIEALKSLLANFDGPGDILQVSEIEEVIRKPKFTLIEHAKKDRSDD